MSVDLETSLKVAAFRVGVGNELVLLFDQVDPRTDFLSKESLGFDPRNVAIPMYFPEGDEIYFALKQGKKMNVTFELASDEPIRGIPFRNNTIRKISGTIQPEGSDHYYVADFLTVDSMMPNRYRFDCISLRKEQYETVTPE